MSLIGSDIFHFIYDHAPLWMASLRTIGKEEDQTHANIKHQLGLPDLRSFDSGANRASVLSLFDSSAPALTSSGSTIPHSSHASPIPKPSPDPKTAPAPLHEMGHSRRDGQQVPSAVFYDGGAQHKLSRIVTDVSQAISIISRSPQRQELRDITQRLQKASEMCHDAAFQLLRDGKSDHHASSASSILQDLFVISCIEVMHERKAREIFGVDQPSQPVVPAESPAAPVSSKPVHIPAVQVADLEDPIACGEDASSLGSDDFSIGPIRLTSRMR